MVRLGELVMILDLAREGLSVSAIARRTGLDRKTIRKYIARGLEAPAYTPRLARPTLLTPFEPYLRERLQAFPDLNARRLLRELKERGYTGGYTILKAIVRAIRPTPSPSFERRFETPPGKQAQVDSAFFKTTFTDEPEMERCQSASKKPASIGVQYPAAPKVAEPVVQGVPGRVPRAPRSALITNAAARVGGACGLPWATSGWMR